MHHHKWSLNDIEDMVPYERSLYINLLSAQLEEEKQKQMEKAARQR